MSDTDFPERVADELFHAADTAFSRLKLCVDHCSHEVKRHSDGTVEIKVAFPEELAADVFGWYIPQLMRDEFDHATDGGDEDED